MIHQKSLDSDIKTSFSGVRRARLLIALILTFTTYDIYSYVPSTLSVRPSVLAGLTSSIAVSKHATTRTHRQESTVINAGLFGNIFRDSEPKETTVISIETNNVKIGALRFLVNIHLVGEQNNPTPKSWLCRQAEDNPSDLQVYYQDGSAMLIIRLQEDCIKMIRVGTKPTLQYLLQESILLHNLLDELQTVAFGIVGDTISQEQRLIQLKDNTAFDKARAKLPARKEK